MLRHFVLALIANSTGLYLVDYFLVDFCCVELSATTCPLRPEISLLAYILGGFSLGLLNLFLKPFLKIVTLPITFLTAGLFLLAVNGLVLAALVWLVNTLNLQTLKILIVSSSAAWTYLSAAIILGGFNLATHWLTKK